MENHEYSSPYNGNVDEVKSELNELGSSLNDQTSLEGHRKIVLTQHIRDLKTNHSDWVSRLMLPPEDKKMLKVFGEKEVEAAEIILSSQNDALRAICASQVSFIKEVVNTMLKTGRSGLKSAASAIYKENALSMQTALTKASNQFYDLLEVKYRDAQTRLPFVQKQIMAEIDLMVNKWQQEFIIIQNDFTEILNEKI